MFSVPRWCLPPTQISVCCCTFKLCVKFCIVSIIVFVCVCARVYALRIASTDKVARFLNTCIIIVVLLIIYPFIVLEMHGLKTFANSVNNTDQVVGEKLAFSLQFSILAHRYLQLGRRGR